MNRMASALVAMGMEGHGHDTRLNPCHLGGDQRLDPQCFSLLAQTAARKARRVLPEGLDSAAGAGSPRLGLVGRLFSASTASALAGLAACPVAVVPSA